MSAGSKPGGGYTGTFSEQLAAFDKSTFRNSQDEELARRKFMRQLREGVGIVERSVIVDADGLRARSDNMAAQAVEACKTLESIENDLSDGGALDAEAWLRADRVYDELVGQLEPLVRRAEAVIERLEDPLAYASSLQERFSPLHRPQLLPPESDVSA